MIALDEGSIMFRSNPLLESPQLLTDCCFFQAHNAVLVEEEATALSIWAVACICGTLKLENVSFMLQS